MKNKIDNVFNVAFLQSGRELAINDKVKVRHPIMEDIYNLGNKGDCENIYWNYVSLMLSDPYDNMVLLDDFGIDYEKFTAFDVFVLKWKLIASGVFDGNEGDEQSNAEHLLNGVKTALCFFLGEHEFDVIQLPNTDIFCLVDLNTKNSFGFYDYYITLDMFTMIYKFIFAINKLDKSDRINPATEHDKKMLIAMTRDEQKTRVREKDKDKNIDYLGNAVNALCSGATGVDYITARKYNVYQVLSSYKTSINRIHCDHLLNGVYFGTVDVNKVNKKDLNWIE